MTQECSAHQLVGVSEQHRLHRNSWNECTCNKKVVWVVKTELHTAVLRDSSKIGYLEEDIFLKARGMEKFFFFFFFSFP